MFELIIIVMLLSMSTFVAGGSMVLTLTILDKVFK
jgi:hypothetical protein